MRKARDIIGLPVFCVSTGKRAGTVRDVLLDNEWTILGVMLDARHWYSSCRYIPAGEITACGQDAVTIADMKSVRSYAEAESLGLIPLNGGKHRLKELPVITADGLQLGTIEDVYLLEQLGTKIIGFELSEGFVSDLMEGRKWLPMPISLTIGEDAVIVPLNSRLEAEEIFVSKEE
ncbi:PRC-barrel domain-containing protein [Paenibacillus chitinolyticus]